MVPRNLARVNKTAREEARIGVYIGEAGFNLRPSSGHTCSLVGQTSILEAGCRYQPISMRSAVVNVNHAIGNNLSGTIQSTNLPCTLLRAKLCNRTKESRYEQPNSNAMVDKSRMGMNAPFATLCLVTLSDYFLYINNRICHVFSHGNCPVST
jgi:hypothetical protein